MILNPYRFSTTAPTTAFDGFGNASRSFDGTNDYVGLGDSDDFSFGDASTDSPFSISAWVKMVDATHFWLATKHDNSTQSEWLFAISGDDKLYFAVYDGGVSVRRGRTSSSTFTSYENQWIHLAATYDGTGGTNADDGMTVYLTTLGGTTTAISTVDFNAGSYTAMHNGTKEIQIGAWTSNSKYANGNIADVRLYNKELSGAEVQSIADGTHVTDSLVGHWLKDTDDVLDHAGVNDGTNNGSTYSYDNPSPVVAVNDPTDIAGLDLWLDASDNSTVLDATDAEASDDEAVKTWQDKSGNANHAVQATVSKQPLRRAAEVNGLDALDFDGSNDFMTGTSDLTPRQTDNKTIFVVTKFDTLGGITTFSPYDTSSIGARGSLFYNTSIGLGYAVAGGYESSTDTTTDTTNPNIHTYSQSGSGNLFDVMTQWQDGVELTRTNGADKTLADNPAEYAVGSWNNSQYFDGRICEIIVYDTELSTTDRESVEAYLADKWGVTI